MVLSLIPYPWLPNRPKARNTQPKPSGLASQNILAHTKHKICCPRYDISYTRPTTIHIRPEFPKRPGDPLTAAAQYAGAREGRAGAGAGAATAAAAAALAAAGAGVGGDGSGRDAPRGNGGRGVDAKGHGRGAASSGALGGSAGVGENGEAMEVDTGEEGDDRFGHQNGGVGQAGVGSAANGDVGLRRDADDLLYDAEEIPDGDVAVLNNHRSEVRVR